MQRWMFSKADDIKQEGLTNYLIGRCDEIVPTTKNKSIFSGSRFEFLLGLNMKQKGLWAERAIKGLAQDHGMFVQKSEDGDWKINGIDSEVKYARENEQHRFTINQLRLKEYEYVVMLIVRPDEALLFTVPKSVILPLSKKQHGEGCYSYSANFEILMKHFSRYMGIEYFAKVFCDR
jgi:hypothetical protein